MGRTEAKNDLSGLEGDPHSGQGLGSPPVQPETEEQQSSRKFKTWFLSSQPRPWEGERARSKPQT